ncbi:MAG: MBL fold metallo-hydrolase [Myxococcales bacterium]|nr:MBL fold metallo-hydrolase [Myxococcales bacterium]
MKTTATAILIATLGLGGCASTSSTHNTPNVSSAALGIEVVTSAEAAGAVNSVLLVGARELVIVDAQFTKSGANAVVEAAAKTGKRVSRIFITHAHPDHYLGSAILARRFPSAKIIASADVVAEMKRSAMAVAASRQKMLGPEFPGMPIIPEVYARDTLVIDGAEVRLMAGLAGDTHPITALFVPSSGTLVASDIGYADVHLWTATSDDASRSAWAKQTEALGKLPGLKRVIPGHQLSGSAQTPALLRYTRAYLDTFAAARKQASAPKELVAAMKKAYPGAHVDLFLQLGAKAAFAANKK